MSEEIRKAASFPLWHSWAISSTPLSHQELGAFIKFPLLFPYSMGTKK